MSTAVTTPRRIALCSCEDTMTLSPEVVAKGCRGAAVTTARHLCGAQIGAFHALAAGGDLTVACTQQIATFEAAAEAHAPASRLTFVNVRETAGWSDEGASSGPKMAALLAAAAVAAPPVTVHTLESEGVALIWGRGSAAVALAERLKDRLDITVLVGDARDVVPPRRAVYPVRQGRIRTLTGHLGAFEITIDGFAEPQASSRQAYAFGPARNGAVSRADIVIDVSGGRALVAASELRHGYLRADPDDPVAIERLAAKAADLVGTFDTPRYISFSADLCAHSRSRIVGCRRCLDLCPAGAITPAGSHVAIDPALCGGCGQCASACPTGAAAYAVPPADILMQRVRAALTAYRDAGGEGAVLLLAGEEHGEALVDAAARFGPGLPASVIPLMVNEIGQIGIEVVAAALAYGARAVAILTRARPRHDEAGVARMVDLARAIATGLGFGPAAVSLIAADDPDLMLEALHERFAGADAPRSVERPASFLPAGGKRAMMTLALRELHRVAPVPASPVALPAGSPFGRIAIDTGGCTLCLACVSTCPTHALGDDRDRPRLTFDESLCVQCGLCAATCPEKVITLEPRLDFDAFTAGAVTVKEEEPFCCIACGTPFGVKSTVERIAARLAERHWMFSGANADRIDLVRMCDTCRVEAVTNKGLDPYGAAARPVARTSDDYFREREANRARRAATGEGGEE